MKLIKTALIFLISARTYGQGGTAMKVGLQSQYNEKDSASITMPAGKQYEASGWKEFWWGKHYRKEWTTPVTFPVLNLSGFEGGLKPYRVGGGHESKTLRLISAEGREYVMRTLDKNLDIMVPEGFKGTFIDDLVNDQISTAHPYGPLAIARLSDSLSFIHTHPRIYYIPDDPNLDEFRSTFANRLVLFEERPSGKGWDHSPEFGNADEIVNSEKLFKAVFSSSRNFVDQRSFLDVRLFDMIVNDWDRHEDQWVWALKRTGENDKYIPIARDRDQAFSKADGVSLYFLSQPWAFRPIENMDSHIKDIRGANFAARNLDQQFLNKLSKEDWKRSIEFIQDHLTDSSIHSGIRAMPTEVRNISGDFLAQRLNQRRDNLMDDGMRYYSMLSKKITINGSDDDELFIIDQDRKNEVSVTGLRSESDTFYHRVFNRSETKEINIYGLGGDDKYVVKGTAKNPFTIRMIGGEGMNQYKADSVPRGKLYRVYDSLPPEGISKKPFLVNRHWDTLYRYHRESVNYDWYIPLIVPGYNVDDGFSVGLGLLYRKQTWGKTPFGWQQSLLVDYATETRSIGFAYRGLFKQTFGKWDLDISSYYKGPRYTFNYYGLGNESQLNGFDKSHFSVKGNDLFFSPGVSRTWGFNYVRFGFVYENVKISQSQEKFVTSRDSKLDPAVFSSINYAGISGQWSFSNADDELFRTKGFQITSGFSYLNNLENTQRKLLKVNGAASFYYTFFDRLTLAHRTGAGTIFGDYEFYQANTLGGDQNLRGFWRSRYAGRSDFFQNTELRLSLGDIRGYVLRGKFGIYGFFDDGRVWIKEDNSSTLHTGYGGGVFMYPYNRLPLTLYYAKSKETSMVTLRAGFFF